SWDSIIRIMEEFPSPVFGPMIVIQLGNPAAAAPRSACIPPAQVSARVLPCAPTTRSARGMSVTWKPVPNTIASASVSVPSAATRAGPRTARRPAATTSACARARAGQQDPRAADAVVAGELGAQVRVLDGPAHVALGQLLDEAQLARVLGERLHLQLPHAPQQSAAQLGGEGQRPVQGALGGADRPVDAGQDPGGGALEEGEAGDERLDGRHDLDR